MANPLSDRFGGVDAPPEVPPTAMGMAPARVTPPATPITPTGTNFADRAKAHMQRALSGISALLGRPFTLQDRTSQLESSLDALQARSSPAVTPNILTTVPRFAPLATPPPPVGTPISRPTPFSFSDIMAKSTPKGS
jgi:hypothetical protein